MDASAQEMQVKLKSAQRRFRMLCGAAMLLLGGSVFLASRPAAVAQAKRPSTPVVITAPSNNNTAGVDSAGRLTVIDPRIRVDDRGRVPVVSSDPCCPKPSQRFQLRTSLQEHDKFYDVPAGKALLIDAMSLTGGSDYNLGRLWKIAEGVGTEVMAVIACRQDSDTRELTFPTGIVFRSGETLFLEAGGTDIHIYGVLVDDE